MAALDHIGIAVADLPAMRRLFSLLGLGITETEAVPEQGVTAHFLPFSDRPGDNAQGHLELLEPLPGEGPIAQFLAKRGPGIHHLSFRVERGKLDPLCAQLREAGYRLLYDAPRSGAHGMRINFIHPASAGGILVEVMEKG